MKVSNYIVQFLIEKGVTDTFGYPGGMVTHIMDSFEKYKDKINTHITYHEQAAAFAACGYAQASNKIGIAYATSGPGATNLVTGIANAFFDSIPCIFLTGQVNTYEQKGDLECRQKGFQETDIVSIVKPITKYAVMIQDEKDIVYEFEKAYYIAKSGRPGPVLIDIPMNIQRAEIDIDKLEKFSCEEKVNNDKDKEIVKIIKDELENAKRPVILAGAGIKSADVKEEFREIVNRLKIPVLTTMIAKDVLETGSSYNFGFIGAYGSRFSNVIISKSDCILSIGSRLDVRQTGSKQFFNNNAKILRIDIDKGELTNKINENEIQLVANLKSIVPKLNREIINCSSREWIKNCEFIKEKLKDIDKTNQTEFIRRLSDKIDDNTNIVTDVGQNQVWISQCFNVKENQEVLFSGGHGAMGYSLPASIGAYYANGNITVSINGDGGLQMNIQELEFLAREKIPIKVIVINNHSLGMIRHFQEMYFESNYTLTVKDSGYSVPDFCKIAKAYGIESYCINEIDEIDNIESILKGDGPALININVGDITYLYPKLGMNQPLYNQEPKISQDLLQELLNL